jgi:hypothetical protein
MDDQRHDPTSRTVAGICRVSLLLCHGLPVCMCVGMCKLVRDSSGDIGIGDEGKGVLCDQSDRLASIVKCHRS